MKLLYITSGGPSYAELDPNLIQAFRRLEKKLKDFHFQFYRPRVEPIATLFNRVQSFRPDVILSLRGAISGERVTQLRKMGIPVGLFVVDDPYLLRYHSRQVPPYTFMVTQESSCLSFYRKRKKPCIHLPLGVNEATYHPERVPEKYQSDICFVGSALPARLHTFDQMVDFLRKKKFVIVGRWWERLKHYKQLNHGIINQTIPSSETAKYYNGAKIVLNIHRTKNDVKGNPFGIPAFTPNNRTFDIAACRSFQLVSQRKELGRYYRLGEEVIAFKGIKDLKQKIEYYLAHDKERERIAARAYQRTLKDHTYEARLRSLIQVLQVRMNKQTR
ncbi:CgeB family protein [Salinithrix halophila]|uniref:Glycosyltransferase n=1 Tax=Salinithrix halophila TaxID=1485204 RepID=A0ABV8JDC2_9BACL